MKMDRAIFSDGPWDIDKLEVFKSPLGQGLESGETCSRDGMPSRPAIFGRTASWTDSGRW